MCGSALLYVPYFSPGWGKVVLSARPVSGTHYIHLLALVKTQPSGQTYFKQEASKCSLAVCTQEAMEEEFGEYFIVLLQPMVSQYLVLCDPKYRQF